MNFRLPRVALVTLVGAACVALVPLARAGEPFPSKPISLVVPFAPGGPSDALARQVAQRLGPLLGQTVMVENVSGAGGTIGTARVAQARPDGHTLAFGTNGTHVANVALYRKLAYDPKASFEPIGLVGLAPLVLIARPGLPVSSLGEFVAHAQTNRAKMSYGSAGIGSISHTGCVMLLSHLQLDIVHVPYRGVAPAMTDLMAGQIDFMCDQTTSALPQIAAGKVKPVAVLSTQRVPSLAQVGSAAEGGHAGLNLRSWNAVFAPKGTPAPVLARLQAALEKVLQDKEFRAQMAGLGVDVPSGAAASPAAVAHLIDTGLKNDVPALKARGEYLD